MAESLLDRAIYAYGDVDRLVGLRPGTARRWLEGYKRDGHFYGPVLRAAPTGSDSVTWGEMVEARMLAEFRHRSVPVLRLRPAVSRLRSELGAYPLARARPFLDVAGRELVRRVQEESGVEAALQLVVVRNGQLVLSDPTQRFQSSIEYVDGVAGRLTPQRLTPEVQMDPGRSFGQPVVRGVSTASLAENFRAGSGREELADLYELTPGQVDAALRFELIASTAHAA